MKSKSFIIITILLIVIIIALGVGLFLIFKDKQKLEDDNKKLNDTINALEDDAKVNADVINKLEDRIEELENNTNNTDGDLNDEDYVIGALEKYFDKFLTDSYEEDGLDFTLSEYKIESVELLDVNELKQDFGEDVLEFEDSIPAEIVYSVKPKNEDSYSTWLAGGESIQEGEWIRNKSAVVEVSNTTKGYTVMNIGTGW